MIADRLAIFRNLGYSTPRPRITAHNKDHPAFRSSAV
jgi:hypothetical protein